MWISSFGDFREEIPRVSSEDQQEDLGHLGHTHIEESTNDLPVQLFHGGRLKLDRFTSSFLKARSGQRDAKAVPIEYMIFMSTRPEGSATFIAP